MKDNHIFRGLATVAAYGIPLEEAKAAGKDVMQVGLGVEGGWRVAGQQHGY